MTTLREQRRSRIFGVLAVALTVVGLGVGCSSNKDGGGDGSANGTTTIRVGSNTNVAVLPAWVAADQGIFSKHGLDVKFTQVSDVSTLPPALGKSFDVVLTPSPSMISAKANGIDIVVSSGATLDTKDNPTAGVVVAKSAGITSMSQLGNKTLGALAVGGAGDIAMRQWLHNEGVDLDTVKIIAVSGPTQADQLNAGRIEAVQTGEPFRTDLLKSGKALDLGDPYLALAPNLTNFTAIEWGSLSSWAKENPKAIDAFRDSLNEAIAVIKAQPQVAVDVLQKYAKLTPDTAKNTVLPEFTTKVQPGDYAIWLDAMKTVGNFKGSVDVSKLILSGDVS